MIHLNWKIEKLKTEKLKIEKIEKNWKKLKKLKKTVETFLFASNGEENALMIESTIEYLLTTERFIADDELFL